MLTTLRSRRFHRSGILVPCVLAVASLAVAGCSNPETGSATSQVEVSKPADLAKDDDLAALVPERIRNLDSVVVGTNAPYPPFVSFENAGSKEIVGLEPDLAEAIGTVLDLKFDFVQQPFEGLIPGLAAGKYDVLMAGFEDTKDRQEIVNLVDYLYDGDGLMVPKGNPQDITDAESLCGHSVGVGTGTTQGETVKQVSEQCVEAGQDPIEVKRYSSTGDVQLAVTSGIVDALLTTYTNASSILDGTDALDLIQNTDPFDRGDASRALVAMIVRKDEPEMAEALRGAIQLLMDDGYYDELTEAYGLSEARVEKATINAATNVSN